MASTSSSSTSGRPDFGPPNLHGAKELDRDAFKKSVTMLAVKVPVKEVSAWKAKLSSGLLRMRQMQNVLPAEGEPGSRLMLLDATIFDALPEATRSAITGAGLSTQDVTIQLDYSHFGTTEILQALIPNDAAAFDQQPPSSFTAVGHIAHVNLRDDFLPYKHLVGQVILDKNEHVKTVVNKLDNIDNQFRFFKMEILAGEDNMIAELSESDCRFRLDFSKVYWNSRLHTEHARLVSLFDPEEVIADAMAGIGPFAVPAGKKGCAVMANDLNPDSYKWLIENSQNNKVQNRLRCYNTDARDFIRSSVREAWAKPFASAPAKRPNVRRKLGVPRSPSPPPPVANKRLVDRFVMNLPDSALEFLDAYIGLYTPLLEEDGFREAVGWKEGGRADRLPTVHCYCFSREPEETAEGDVVQRASSYLSYNITPSHPGFKINYVRHVAPMKHMYRLDFVLPPEVAFAPVPAEEHC